MWTTAVELFQIKMGLFVDGRVGPTTWKALRRAHLRRLDEDSLLHLVRGFDDKVTQHARGRLMPSLPPSRPVSLMRTVGLLANRGMRVMSGLSVAHASRRVCAPARVYCACCCCQVDLDVVMLQQKLQLVVGADCVKVDGVYGPRTTNAVSVFMRAQGLTPPELPADETLADSASIGAGAASVGGAGDEEGDGSNRKQMSPAVQSLLHSAFLSELESKALRTASSAASSGDEKVIVDEDVRLLQVALNTVMGKQLVKTDGAWGPRTREAVDIFQRTYGLPLEGDVAEQLNAVGQVLRQAAASTVNERPASS